YSRQLGVSPGEELELCLSGDGPVDAAVLRYRGPKITDGQEIDRLASVPAAPQAIHRGSYVYVERGVGDLDTFSAEVWFRPLVHSAPGSAPTSAQASPRRAESSGLIQQQGFDLKLDECYRPVFRVEGAGTSWQVAGPAVSAQTWHHLVGGFGGGQLV